MSTKKFYKTTLLLGSTYALISVLNLVKQKIIAHYTGLTGMGILGLVNPYSYFLYAFGSLSMYAGVTKYISEYKLKENQEDLSTLWTTAFYTLFLFSLGITLLCLIFAQFLGKFFMGDISLVQYFIIVTLSLPFYVLGNLYLAGFKGVQSFWRLAMTQLVAAILSIFLTFFLVIKFQIPGMIYSLTLSMIILTLITFFSSIFSSDTFLRAFRFKIDWKILKNLMGFSGTVLSTGLLQYGIQFYIRVQIVKILGMEKNGAIQAALYFSLYFQIIQDAINSYLFPRLSELTDSETINKEINTGIRLSAMTTIPATAGLILFIHPIVNMLLTRDFHIIETFVIYLFLGDIIRLLYWIMGTLFLTQRKLKLSFWISILYSLLYGVLIYAIMQKWDMTGFAIGYLIANLCIFAVTFIYVNRLTGFQIQKENGILIVTGIILIILCNLAHWQSVGWVIGACGILLLWTLYIIRKNEWDYIKEKLPVLFNRIWK